MIPKPKTVHRNGAIPGHQVKRLYNKAVRNGLLDLVVLTSEEETALRKGAKYYAERTFNYFDLIEAVTGFKGAPSAADLESVAAALIAGLKVHVWVAVDTPPVSVE